MKKVMRWIGMGLLGLTVLILMAGAGLYFTAAQRQNKVYSLADEQLSIPTGMASISRGQRLVTARCAGCHGANAAGTVIFQDALLGTITASNLTAGRGIDGARLQDADYLRAIRHGVDHTGRAIMTMPSEFYFAINDQDMADMIAYLKSSAAVENPLPETRIEPVGMVLIGAGVFGNLFSAETIDHQAARPAAVEPGVTAAYGDYLVLTGQCRTCHGMALSGGRDPDPSAPPAPDLTRGGELSAWSETDFIQLFRSGKTPSGRQMNRYMPWKEIGQMTDDELKAMWLYLQTLPSQTANKK